MSSLVVMLQNAVTDFQLGESVLRTNFPVALPTPCSHGQDWSWNGVSQRLHVAKSVVLGVTSLQMVVLNQPLRRLANLSIRIDIRLPSGRATLLPFVCLLWQRPRFSTLTYSPQMESQHARSTSRDD